MPPSPPSPKAHRSPDADARIRAFRALTGFRLRTRRAELHGADGGPLLQAELATRLGRPQSYVSRLEQGAIRLDLALAWEIAIAYALPAEMLIAPPRTEAEQRVFDSALVGRPISFGRG